MKFILSVLTLWLCVMANSEEEVNFIFSNLFPFQRNAAEVYKMPQGHRCRYRVIYPENAEDVIYNRGNLRGAK